MNYAWITILGKGGSGIFVGRRRAVCNRVACKMRWFERIRYAGIGPRTEPAELQRCVFSRGRAVPCGMQLALEKRKPAFATEAKRTL
jgi:hypothetical protein